MVLTNDDAVSALSPRDRLAEAELMAPLSAAGMCVV
jgi:hypothetical protein